MFKRRTTLFGSVIVIAFAGLFLLLDKLPVPNDRLPVPNEGPNEGQEPAPEEVSLVFDEALFFNPVEDFVISPDKTGSVKIPEASTESIPGEFAVHFASQEQMEAFIDSIADSGLSVLSAIPELLMVRVSGSGDALAALLPEGSSLETNNRVRAPLLPDEEFWQSGILAAFKGDAVNFLDAPQSDDRLGWGEGVLVAVLDTGWNGHPSIPDGVVRQIDLLEGEVDGTYTAHGTAVAGLIASTDSFAPGIAPGSNILSVRVLDSNGQGNAFTLARGIISAVNNGADVINMSLGGYANSLVLREAVEFANSKGVVLVAAAGNDGVGRLTYPAAYDSVIGVNAVDANGNRAPFSNFGDGLDLAAPGFQVHTLWDGESYAFFDGTSASAPLVSGMVARLLQTGAADSPSEVQSLLRQYANDTGLPGIDPQYGAGLLNAARLESINVRGLNDLALADLYPAVELSDGATVPLYVTFQNRGSEFTPGSPVDITVNGSPYFFRLPGIAPGQVESVTVPLPLSRLNAGEQIVVTAVARTAEGFPDDQPANNGGRIVLRLPPDE